MLEQLKATTLFDNDGTRSRMVLELSDAVPIIGFQVEMMRNNRIPGLLPLEVRRVDSKIQLYYDVTGKWRLKDLLDNKEFSGTEFTSLLERMIQALTASEAYLLDVSQFVLDEDHIFLDGGMEPHLLYLPVKGRQNIHQRFKELLLQLIVYRARLKDQDSGPLLSGILNYLKREHFNLYEFQKALRNLGGSARGQTEGVVQKLEPVQKKAAPLSLGDLIPPEGRQVSPMVSVSYGPSPQDVPVQVQGKPSDRNVPHAVPETKTKQRYKASAIGAALLFQGVLAAGALYGFGPVYTATEDLTTAYAAMALMGLCLDGLVLKNLLKPENRVEVQVPVKKKAPSSQAAAPVQTGTVPAPVPRVNLEKQVISNAPVRAASGTVYDTEVLAASEPPCAGSEDTVVLSAQPAMPYLVRKGPVQEIIRLKQPALVLGRQADMADHVINDPAIGRMHAELSWINNLCQIRDLNSKNGTFVNGQRLAGPHPLNIFVGDEIRLGSLEYTLVQD